MHNFLPQILINHLTSSYSLNVKSDQLSVNYNLLKVKFGIADSVGYYI